jgi:hypothetical protein
MSLILLIVVLVLLFGGGGGYYGYRRWGSGGGIGIVGLVLIILLVLYLFGGLRLWQDRAACTLWRLYLSDGLMREAIVSARWIKICGLLAFVVIGSATLSVASRWPFTRNTVVRALHEKFASTVEFNAFYGTYFTPGFIAEGVTFRRHKSEQNANVSRCGQISILISFMIAADGGSKGQPASSVGARSLRCPVKPKAA